MRTILCVDMDAFFASVEQKANPALRGRPIAVAGRGKRTVVMTSSYEARKRGVKTGMNIYEAKMACPEVIIVRANNGRYAYTCSELQKIYSEFTPDVEIYSVDEAFLDITLTGHLFGGHVSIGRAIKQKVKDKFGINCTVGIGPNVLTAKLASDLGKPDGLKEIRAEDLPHAIADVPVGDLWGIGRKISHRLGMMGIKTCMELASAPASLLRSIFGIYGETLKRMGAGICIRALITDEPEPRSIGHSYTLPFDISSEEEVRLHLLRLSEMVASRMRRHGYMGRTVSSAVRDTDFETRSAQTGLKAHTNDTHEIFKNAFSLIWPIARGRRIRLLAVSVSSLVRDPGQMHLVECERKRQAVLRAMDDINARHGDFKIAWASYAVMDKACRKAMPGLAISPSWKPKGVKNINL